MDIDAPKIFATSGAFTESAMQFMTPPNATNLSALRARGAKLIVYHGTGDPIFSFNDTANWYNGLQQPNTKGQQFARLFPVPGMNHCSGGPSTDQFDMLSMIVNWVEKGVVPDSVRASVSGTSKDLPSTWSKVRSRPLCAYPEVARYKGTGDPESADSFACETNGQRLN
nr:tannase/feruloyl esterase family alpha/beta hydrolase [Burkholderia cepacia]